MIADETKTETPAATNQSPAPTQPPKAINPAAVKKAISLGKEIRKQPEKTKADAARAMFELVAGEPPGVCGWCGLDSEGGSDVLLQLQTEIEEGRVMRSLRCNASLR